MKKTALLLALMTLPVLAACNGLNGGRQQNSSQTYSYVPVETSEVLTDTSGVSTSHPEIALGAYVNSINCGYISQAKAPEQYTMYLIETEEEKVYAEKYLGMKEPDNPDELWNFDTGISDAFQDMKTKYPISDYNYLIYYLEYSQGGHYSHADSVTAEEDMILFHYDVVKSPEGDYSTDVMDGNLILGAVPKDFFENRTFVNTVSPIKYDIEKVFTDPVFWQIVEGEEVPAEIIHGEGGEGGYHQDSTADPDVISEYIEALKECRITDIITDEEQMVYAMDGINDYIFRFEDGREILISMDLNAYILIRNEDSNSDKVNEKEYVLEFSQKLRDLNEQIYVPDQS